VHGFVLNLAALVAGCLDQTRKLYPTSGTAVRQDLVPQWDMLSPAVRAGLAMRVVVVGAESAGTTTLSRELVPHYACVVVCGCESNG